MAAEQPLAPGAVIGILGGGQLGRMLSIAAARIGFRCHIYDPSPEPPAGDVAHAVTTAAWGDEGALAAFARAVDLVTWEFENVPLGTAQFLEARVPVRPAPRALEVAQDRVGEKDFVNSLGVATAPWRAVETAEALTAALAEIGAPAILKSRRLGYDGKGQVRIETPAAAPAAWDALRRPAVLEQLVPFRRELSVIAARGRDGRVVCYDPGENLHRDGILRRTTVPAAIDAAQRRAAVDIADRILTALDYVGVMAVELFEARDGRLLVNEIAPRVHNSGHWTIEACLVDQFQNHVRAISGWPLGDGRRHADAVMENLIGDEVCRWPEIAADPTAALHIYGKRGIRPGRKMGHVTWIRPSTA